MYTSHKLWVFVSVVLVLALAFPALAFVGTQANQSAALHLKAGTYHPIKGQALKVPPGLAVSEEAVARKGYGYYIVQFAGPVQDGWKANLEGMGAVIAEYIPDNAFKVRMNPGLANRIEKLPQVAYVGFYEPAFKKGPELKQDVVGLFTVRPERGAATPELASELTAAGVEVLRLEAGALLVAASPEQVDTIARTLDVAWIENFAMYQTHNDQGAGGIMGATVANSLGYDGSTQIVAVADTGLGGGTAETAHADIPAGRIVAIYNWRGVDDSCWSIRDDGAADVNSGHGTHVAGSVLGDGDDNGIGKGTAPGASLVFQATENFAWMLNQCAVQYTSGYYLTGLPTDLRELFQQAYDAGARIHTNSWGSAVAGDYTANSAYADEFAWFHKDMLITFSAGNAGTDANRDGVIDNDSIGAPGTAKNVLTVGASENARSDNFPCDTSLTYNSCASQGGLNIIFTWASGWAANFPANPIANDPSAGNAQQMAAFSSRGPTDDGRIKPDLVAPGSWVLSTYSDMYQQGYDSAPNPRNNAFQNDGYGYPYSQGYKYFSGTSMANPLLAGGAAVVRDYFNKMHGIQASGALVKASLINSASDLLDENNDGVNDNDFPIPNSHEGWGLVNLANATDNSAQFLDQANGLSTGTAQSFYYGVNAGTPLKVTIAWTDYPSTEAAAINLVNDLDLTVTAPDGTIYKGNVFSGGWSATAGTADRRNVVENVFVAAPAAGTWTVTVSGYNVPQGPQPFALVVDGSLGQAGPTPTPAPATSTPTLPPPTASPTPQPSPTPLPGLISTGYQNPSANAAVTKRAGDNNGFELNPANAYLSDNLYALDANSGTSTSLDCANIKRDSHVFYDYNFSLPAGKAIQGIEVMLEGKSDSTAGSPMLCVELSWDGGRTWTIAKVSPTLSTSDSSYILGSPSDTWNRTWNSGELTNTNFRLRIIPVSTNTARDFWLDYVGVNVTYQP